VYRDPRGRVVAEDTMFATHRGPLYQTSLGWLSVRWTARELSDEGDSFRRAMRTSSVADWYAAMETYRTPAQNFLVADRTGMIGIRSTGRYPIRPGDGRGDRIFDGSSTANDWVGDQPLAWYPQTRAPRQGYIASANQQPMDPMSRRGYQGSEWPSPWRAMRINNLLRGNAQMTPDLMRQFQTDPKSELTGFVMTAVGDAMEAAKRAGTWTADDESAFGLLSKWDGAFSPDASGAVLFDALVQSLTRKTWDELILTGEDRRVATPGQMILVRLLSEPSSVWWDDRSTDGTVENRDAIVLASLRDAWTTTKERLGDDQLAWKWSDVRVARVHHLLRLPGFGRDSLVVSSGPGTLSPSDAGGTHGASWRFVVELGPTMRAWGTYPGGQSGNPLSSRYDDRLELWRTGALAELRVPRAATELAADRTAAVLTLRPE
jgi:penicillin amidase